MCITPNLNICSYSIVIYVLGCITANPNIYSQSVSISVFSLYHSNRTISFHSTFISVFRSITLTPTISSHCVPFLFSVSIPPNPNISSNSISISVFNMYHSKHKHFLSFSSHFCFQGVSLQTQTFPLNQFPFLFSVRITPNPNISSHSVLISVFNMYHCKFTHSLTFISQLVEHRNCSCCSNFFICSSFFDQLERSSCSSKILPNLNVQVCSSFYLTPHVLFFSQPILKIKQYFFLFSNQIYTSDWSG